jgi:hypothetical protein
VGDIVRILADRLRDARPGQTLLVLPEGQMLNYLSRKPSPLPQVFYFSWFTSNGREDAIVSALHRRPPDWIAIVSRDLREYGIQRYGERPGSGRQILTWVAKNYEVAGSVGGDPLDYRQRGGLLLKRKLQP